MTRLKILKADGTVADLKVVESTAALELQKNRLSHKFSVHTLQGRLIVIDRRQVLTMDDDGDDDES